MQQTLLNPVPTYKLTAPSSRDELILQQMVVVAKKLWKNIQIAELKSQSPTQI